MVSTFGVGGPRGCNQCMKSSAVKSLWAWLVNSFPLSGNSIKKKKQKTATDYEKKGESAPFRKSRAHASIPSHITITKHPKLYNSYRFNIIGIIKETNQPIAAKKMKTTKTLRFFFNIEPERSHQTPSIITARKGEKEDLKKPTINSEMAVFLFFLLL